MIRSRLVIILLFCLSSLCNLEEIKEPRPRTTQIVLLGATGDLAQKYLWKGLFNLYLEKSKPGESVRVYGAAREDLKKGRERVQRILESTVHCSSKLTSRELENCEKKLKEFRGETGYFCLKKSEDYEAFCSGLNSEGAGEDVDLGRIFYLSVPPSAYGTISKSINKYCRPGGNNSYLRVVLEKPFGSDLASAKRLAEDLEQFFEEKEIYRIDHYLGKTGVSQILKFRTEHGDRFSRLWNKDSIQSVEIGLNERDGCQGRTGFYNQYGVIRDVLQNHLTEVMALVGMETPGNISNLTEIHQNKLRFLKDINPPHEYSSVIGQYEEYTKHCESDRGKSEESDHKTPTFAAVLLYLNNAKWNKVPFLMVSGKQLKERKAYVRIIFKTRYSISDIDQSVKCPLSQLIFHIQGGNLNKPALIISKSLPSISKFSGWKPSTSKPEYLYGCPGDSYDIFEPLVTEDAYTALIRGVYLGRQELFIGTQDLMASWEVWTPLLRSLESVLPRVYSQDNLKSLDFSITGQRLELAHPESDGSCYSRDDNNCESIKSSDFYKPTLFRGQPLVTGSHSYIVKELASKIQQHASAAVSSNGVFHLALSGGSSPVKLYDRLALFLPDFPWHVTHVWFVDERCTKLTDQHSNFNMIYKSLLQYVPIPALNIHPMPVQLQGCSKQGFKLYEADLRESLGESSLDFVVLGAGTDGHTASLFPNALPSSKDWVAITESLTQEPVGLRITMTLELLNRAKSIAVLVHGEKKVDIVEKLSGKDGLDFEFPITCIKPGNNNQLTWFIDDKALGRDVL